MKEEERLQLWRIPQLEGRQLPRARRRRVEYCNPTRRGVREFLPHFLIALIVGSRNTPISERTRF